jgi:hypothetical protein
MPTGIIPGHIVYSARAKQERELILQRARQVARERAAFLERLSQAQAARQNLPLAVARKHIAQVAVTANPTMNAAGDNMHHVRGAQMLARYG